MELEFHEAELTEHNSFGNGITRDTLISGSVRVTCLVHQSDPDKSANVDLEVWFTNDENNQIIIEDWQIFATYFLEKDGKRCEVDKFVMNNVTGSTLESAVDKALKLNN